MPRFTQKNTFIVIPAYNEGPRIRSVLLKATKSNHPVIVIDDGSGDSTYKAAQVGGAEVFKHNLNLGKGAALKTGCEAAFARGAKAIVVLDADGQHDPKYIKSFVSELNKNDVVFGKRKLAGKAPFIRFAGNKLGAALIHVLFGIYRQDLLCGYIAFTKDAYSKIQWKSPRYGIESEVVARTGKNKLKYSEIEISTIYIDKHKGVSILDALAIFPSVFKWRFD